MLSCKLKIPGQRSYRYSLLAGTVDEAETETLGNRETWRLGGGDIQRRSLEQRVRFYISTLNIWRVKTAGSVGQLYS